ncbi:NAD-dependent epimerase/dehydratase family protein [Phocaeicola vulgatus]|uniref:NAD-dependent epimerase/dehydratase family protein n=1 Tax=Phocaeicola vulgatus TaxID=821 RepID=UPI003561A8E5
MSKKKVLVIGGTGIAGQFITDYLLHYHDICELFIASRGIHKISEKKVKFIKMDIHDTQNIESVIKVSSINSIYPLVSDSRTL